MTTNTDRLAQMRALAQKQQEQTEYTGDTRMYSFYDNSVMPVGSSLKVRFIPDPDTDNIFFWKEKRMFNFEFNGTTDDPSKKVYVRVPCIKMFDKTKACPVLQQIQPLWNAGPEMEALARKYYFKKTYMVQGILVDTPEGGVDTVENPDMIRIFDFGKQIFDKVYSFMNDVTEFKYSPDDIENGTDFIINKTERSGGKDQFGKPKKFNDYTTSTYSRNTRALSDEEREALDNAQKLSDLLPKMPTDEELDGIEELFKASFNGEPYDADRFAWLPWRPAGVQKRNKPVSSAKIVIKAEEDEVVAAPQKTVKANTADVDDINIDALLADLK